jgi:hypothetical protein
MEKECYGTAEGYINHAVDQSGRSPDGLLSDLEKGKDQLEKAEAAKVSLYQHHVREALHGTFIAELESGIGGMYSDTGIQISTDTLMIGGSFQATIDQIEETAEHEKYHRDNNHLDPMQLGASAHDDIVATIGSVEFTDTQIVEGLTVLETGDQFVSQEYIEHEQCLTRAMAAAALSVEDVRQAVNEKKDYGLVDDESRKNEELQVALAS